MTKLRMRYLQYIAAIAGNLSTMGCGVLMGWTSPILVRLENEDLGSYDNPLRRPITKDESSWIGSLIPFGVMFGTIFSSYLGEWFGRKRTLLISTLPFIVGWVLVGTAKCIEQIYVGRFILGLGAAIPYTVLPMYIGEISDVSIRGILGTFLQIFNAGGILFGYAIGPYVSYSAFWIICLIPNLLFFVCYIFMPESPYFLLSKDQESEAAAALSRFRNKKDVREEIKAIQAEIDEQSREKMRWRDVFKTKVNKRAIILTTLLMCFQELIGCDVMAFYTENIFHDAKVRDTAVSTIIVGSVEMIGSVSTPLLVDRCGRKLLLFASSVGCGLSMAVFGVYFYFKESNYDVTVVNWVPVAALIVYTICFGAGWGPIPYTILGEMFAPAVKSKASSICIFFMWMCSFLLTKLFTNIKQAFGSYTGFWLFSCMCVINVVFVAIFIPETKGKTLSEIQKEINGDNRNDDSVENRSASKK